jgi:DNA helicase-2/ATP-dependent DNA helicase PcrA
MAEIEEIFEHINNGRNFLLSGGAGSGKTYTLVQVIKKVIVENPSALIACMTYTNAAVEEIEERVDHQNLNVTTIHDFLWDNIKHFQKELKKCLVELANDEEVKAVKIDSEEPIPEDFFDDLQDPNNPENKIQYKEFLRISKGIISHDQIIAVSDLIFQQFPKLGDIVKDKYKFIFIDEYQDTQEEVVKIFLEHFKLTTKRNVVGFFGDAMQSIYDNTIGNLDEYKGEDIDKVQEVKKEQNRRNPSLVIDLANKLRTDGLEQVPSDDNSAPNMINGTVKVGEIKFLYSDDGNIDTVKEHLGWDFENSKDTKELNLTHNLIADKANFRSLMNIYDKDKILDYKKRIKDYIKANPVEQDLTEMTFGEVIDYLKAGKTGSDLRKVEPTNGMQEFIDNHPDLYASARETKFQDLSRIYVEKDQLLDDKKKDEDDINKKGSKRDELIKHLYRLQSIIWLYQNGQYNEFLQETDFRGQLYNTQQKRILKERIDNLVNVGNKTIGEVIEEAHENEICIKGDGLIRFETEKKYVFDRVKSVPFKEFQALYEYLEGRTPFLTQHKTKGAEYDNVLVILDNGGWPSFNFKYLFENTPNKDSVINRTCKLFYVCCTRAKEQLVVYFHSPSNQVIDKAKEWFGEENVINLET